MRSSIASIYTAVSATDFVSKIPKYIASYIHTLIAEHM